MEKLIELLNEYRRIDFIPERQKGILMVAEEKVISKKYWFVKRLVDNDKIDLEELDYEIRKYNSYIDSHWYYDALLMILVIQDNPIEFLISILK